MSDEIKKEDGPKREFSTGAESQASSGKGTPVLVPGDAIIDVAKHFEKGADIYGARNWEKGIPLSELLNSLERHLQQEKMGMTDEPHARALAWRALVYLATKLRIENGLLPAELNDMPVYTTIDETIQNLMKIDYAEVEIKTIAALSKETIEEVLAINEEMANELDKEPIKEIVDTMKSMVYDDGKWYCSHSSCNERGFSNTAPNTFYCDEHRKED